MYKKLCSLSLVIVLLIFNCNTLLTFAMLHGDETKIVKKNSLNPIYEENESKAEENSSQQNEDSQNEREDEKLTEMILLLKEAKAAMEEGNNKEDEILTKIDLLQEEVEGNKNLNECEKIITKGIHNKCNKNFIISKSDNRSKSVTETNSLLEKDNEYDVPIFEEETILISEKDNEYKKNEKNVAGKIYDKCNFKYKSCIISKTNNIMGINSSLKKTDIENEEDEKEIISVSDDDTEEFI